MNREQKGQLYEELIREGDAIQRKIAALRTTNIGIDDSPEKAKELASLNGQMAKLEQELMDLQKDEWI